MQTQGNVVTLKALLVVPVVSMIARNEAEREVIPADRIKADTTDGSHRCSREGSLADNSHEAGGLQIYEFDLVR